MDWFQAVDIYCERTNDLFWAEPVNALSNLAFPVAALWAAITAQQRRITAPVVWLLITMAALIGVGSFLFHTYANGWSEYADTIPIWGFVALFVATAMHRVGGVAPGRLMVICLIVAAILTVVFLASGEGATRTTPDPFNGSGQYAPALIALLIFAAVSLRRSHPLRFWITAAMGTFLVSLVFRTIDMAVCPTLPLGTHFIWHILNALMIGLLLQVLVRHRAPPASI